MSLKYNQPIKQYSLEGQLLNTFEKATSATHIINYDSIISCCLGKYKTAGGFVWRFETDDFSLSSSRDKNNIIKCQICSSNESVRSMSMHLRFAHKSTTAEYIEKYGEFRPKQLKNIQLADQSNIECKICNEKLKSNQHLMHHINKFHPEITKSQYIINYLLEGQTPLCKCGCGQSVTLLENGKNCDLGKDTYHRDYIKGHWDWEVFSGIRKQSKEEIELINYIKTIYNKEIQTSVRGIIPNSELDIYLPDINLGIEYNGLYWHSERAGRYKDYHINKLKKCNEKNIRLIQIFSDEWINKKDIVKSKIRSIISPKSNKIYARKCIIKEISPQEKNSFLNQYHIQGEDRSQIKLGLFYEDELVAVMTFSSPRVSLGAKKSNNNTYELSRYSSSYYIVGGADKLLTYFIKHYNPSSIYSYSDNRWTDPSNNMYLKMGFTIQSTSLANYFYTKDFTQRLHRYNFNKYNLKKMGADTDNKTEFKIMDELGYTRIWDCGTTKYIKVI